MHINTVNIFWNFLARNINHALNQNDVKTTKIKSKIKNIYSFQIILTGFIKIVLKFSLTILLVLLSNRSYAQNNLENKYQELKKQLVIQNTKLDSLNVILQKKINDINKEKNKKNYDKSVLTELLSGTANLTNKIETLQKTINELNLQFKETKDDLVKYYTKQIAIIRKSELREKEKEQEIAELTEKKLLVLPKIDVLTFDPKKILLTQKPTDPIKQKIYMEYLAYAKNEIENKIKETVKLKKEIDDIILLKEKSEEFLEESTFDNDVINYSSSEKTSAKSSEFDGSYFYGSKNRVNNIADQTSSFFQILNQIKLSSITKEQDYGIDRLNLNEKTNIYKFKKIIDLVEQRLKEYLSVIKGKMK